MATLKGHDMPASFDQLGQMFIGTAIATVAWVMKAFTRQHLESMDKLADKVDGLAGDVREMKVDIRSLKDHSDRLDNRIEKLEDKGA